MAFFDVGKFHGTPAESNCSVHEPFSKVYDRRVFCLAHVLRQARRRWRLSFCPVRKGLLSETNQELRLRDGTLAKGMEVQMKLEGGKFSGGLFIPSLFHLFI